MQTGDYVNWTLVSNGDVYKCEYERLSPYVGSVEDLLCLAQYHLGFTPADLMTRRLTILKDSRVIMDLPPLCSKQ